MDSAPLTPASLAAARAWFRTEARAYPWSLTEDPYAIWVSEIMLQQTVVTAAVVPYEAWMSRWPSLESLAAAGEDEVLRAWEGLGYASRARNLHRAARTLADRGQRFLPDTEAELRALPGVGEYTAAALLSFAFHQPALTLDANLKRVFQRLDAAAEWTPSLEARWRALWADLVDGAASRESNQAIMQLGQRVCRAKNPLCASCPLAAGCRARNDGVAESIPASKVRAVIDKATIALVWKRLDGSVWWLARPEQGRFSNLWLAPPLEVKTSVPLGARPLTSRLHTYTKYRDRVQPWLATWTPEHDPTLPTGWMGRWATVGELKTLGMVSCYRKILDEALSLESEFSD